MTLVKNAAQNPVATVNLTIDEPELESGACKWVGKAMNDKFGEDISWVVVQALLIIVSIVTSQKSSSNRLKGVVMYLYQLGTNYDSKSSFSQG